MLDRKFIIDNLDRVKKNSADRGVKCDVDRLVELEAERRKKLQSVEEANRKRNDVEKMLGKAKDADERESMKEEGRRLREQKEAAQAEHDRLDAEARTVQATIPNLTHPDAPIGGEKDSRDIRHGATAIRKIDFKPLDHVTLGEKLGLVDFEAGARTTGHGFYFLKNDAVLLDLALQRYAFDVLLKEEFTLTSTPDLAQNKILEGIGFNPRGPETQVYSIENSDLSLVGTAEITLGGMYFNETIDADVLPLKLCGISHCFRTEAGAHGAATRGLYRVHQKGEKGTQFVHTLNGTAVALSRAIIAVIENYQQADGSIVVPDALKKWVGKDRIS